MISRILTNLLIIVLKNFVKKDVLTLREIVVKNLAVIENYRHAI